MSPTYKTIELTVYRDGKPVQLVQPVCTNCGALVYNEDVHDEWHSFMLDTMRLALAHEEMLSRFDPDR